METYDFLMLGGGKAGKTLAMDRARAGNRVALVEAGMIGGSCINVACIPTKTLVRSAEVAALGARGEEFGTLLTAMEVDMVRVAERTAAVVAEMVQRNRNGFEASGLDLVLGWGRFVASRVVEVATATGPRLLTAPRIYLDLGTRAAIPATPGLREAAPLTHVEALELKVLPSHLIVLGGGFVGLELAQAFRRLGSEVTVIERGPRIAPREDEDVSAALRLLLLEDGVSFALGATVSDVTGRSGDEVRVVAADGRTFIGSHLLVAAGREPMTRDIGLDVAGVEVDARGFIAVDDRLRTSAPDVWAMGECAGSPMFTHAALDDYRVAKSGLEGGARTTRDRLIPSCVFIDPEFARVGMNEAEARRAGLRYRLAVLPTKAVPRAVTLGETKGFLKAIVAEEDDRMLGFSMLGSRAGEVVAVVQMAMIAGLPFTALRDAIITHPTMAEGLNMLFSDVRQP